MSRAAVVFMVALCFGGCCCRSVTKQAADADLTKTYRSAFETILADLISAEGKEVSIADVRETFGGFWLNGKLVATGGVLGDLSTLTIETISYAKAGNTTTVNFEVKMDPLKAKFSHFEVSTRLFSSEGSVAAAVVGNLIDIKVRITQDSTCSAVLDHVKLDHYDDIDITDLNVGSYAEELFVKNMMELAKSVYVDEVIFTAENQLKQFLSPYIQQVCTILSS